VQPNDELYAWEGEGWIEQVFPTIVPRAPKGSVVRPGSLWVSKATQRRGRVLWASGGLVKLVYSESDPNAFKIMAETDLTNLYELTK
jgi:hypothetical protein